MGPLFGPKIGLFWAHIGPISEPLPGPVFSGIYSLSRLDGSNTGPDRAQNRAQNRALFRAHTPKIGLFAHRQIPQNQEQMHICGSPYTPKIALF